MGTRSLTHVITEWTDKTTQNTKKKTLVTLYRQMDGYPSGMGYDLVEFLEGSKIVNGISLTDKDKKPKRTFNGAGCLAAQLIAHFKTGVGGFYIEPINAKNCGEEYVYELIVNEEKANVRLRCFEIGYMRGDKYINKRRLLFDGKPEDFHSKLNLVNQN